jgi:hypothetical protein
MGIFRFFSSSLFKNHPAILPCLSEIVAASLNKKNENIICTECSIFLALFCSYESIHCILNLIASYSNSVASNGSVTVNNDLGKNMEGSGSGLFSGTVSAFAWMERGKPRKISVRIVIFPPEIRTNYLQNTSQKS